MPLFSVSCGSQKITFSGFETSFGKNIAGDYHQNGNIFAVFIIVPAVALLILSFFIYKTKRILLFKNIFLIAPLFSIFAAVVIKAVLKSLILKKIAGLSNFDTNSFFINFINKGITVRAEYGFALYIIFNAVVLVFASVNYFVKRE
ncbi:MAG: hypothetical protein FWD71_12250 [Oscillospiraceae bacterium]|nr:hypothetical protein [Oscillospiraceae bacterium]